MSKSQLAKLDVPFGLTQPRINIVYNSAIQHRIVFLVLSGSVSWAYNDSILWRSRNKQAEKWKATNNLVVVATRKCWFIHGKLYIVFHCQLCLYSRLIYCIPYLCCNFHYLCHLFSLAFQQVVFFAFWLFWFSYKLKVTGEDDVFTENGVHTATHMH